MKNLFKYDTLFDSHAHINAINFDKDRDKVVQNSINNDVSVIFDIGTDLTTSNFSIALAKEYPGKVYSFVGIDPEVFVPGSHMFIGHKLTSSWFDEQYEALKIMIENNREFIKGIGETGMDYYWLNQKFYNREIDKTEVEISRKNQERLFDVHASLAQEFNLPLTIHSRGAEQECIDFLHKKGVTGVFHSYTGGYDIAKKMLDKGFYIGVNGIVTFKNSYILQGTYKKILGKVKSDWSPIDFYREGVYFETDCPFLAPESKRGQRNEPANVKVIFEKLLEILK